jgi:hypothetical protein
LAAPFVERDLSIRVFTETTWEQIGANIVAAVTQFYQDSAKQRENLENERLQQRLDELKKRKE